jgi:hypothetical protein
MYRIRGYNWCAGSYLKRSLKGLEVKKVLAKAMHALLTYPSSGGGHVFNMVDMVIEVLIDRIRYSWERRQ